MIEHARAGQFVKTYKPEPFNINRMANEYFAMSPQFAFSPSTLIFQQKEYPDESFYQGNINWDTMRSKTDATIIRAGQGTYEDPQFRTNWAEAKKREMKRGLYWFFDDRYDPGAQATKLCEMIQYDLPEMEVWVDWENTYGGPFGSLRNVVAMMQAIENRLPLTRVGIYSGFYWFRDHSNAITNVAQYVYLQSRPLWLGYYAEAQYVQIPAPWDKLTVWQWGTPAVGAEYGVQSAELDMNYFGGTNADFYSRYGGETLPAPTEDTMTITLTADLLAGQTSRLRMFAGLNGGIIQTLTGPLHIQGTGAKVLVDGYWWIQVVSPVAGWVALTTSYGNVVYTPPVATSHTVDVYVDGVKEWSKTF